MRLKSVFSLFFTAVYFLFSFDCSFAQVSRQRGQIPTYWGQEQESGVSSFRSQKIKRDDLSDDNLLTPELGSMPGLKGLGEAGASMIGSQYHVHVLGDVRKPGTYLVTASTRASQAIAQSGGLMPQGSKRHIELRRAGKTLHIDLVGYEQMGLLDNNPYLMDNDVIYVPLSKEVVQVVGAVGRPNIYELNGEKNIEDIIKLAGGFGKGASQTESTKVIRFVNDKKEVMEIDSSSEDHKNFNIRNGDVIFVPSVITAQNEFDYNVEALPGEQAFYPSYEDRVFVLGGVNSPGAYPFSPYYRINQYLSLSGGVNDRGSPKFKVTSLDGKTHKAKMNTVINPGDTIMVKQHWMSPVNWISFVMGMMSFGLSVTATTLALTR